jgi:1-acyl-sn-glycerol-3-phosphate acyltransferase
MIEARKSRLFERLFLAYTRKILRRQFHHVSVGGVENIALIDRTRPFIFCCNHSSWWDGMIAFVLSKDLLRCDSYAMMEEKQMNRYRFFRKIGAFSVVRESPRQAVASMRYAASLFGGPNVGLWIYPQGVMLPNDVRPLGLQQGAARIASLVKGVQFVPVAHRYEFLQEQRPEALVLFGKPWTPDISRTPREITAELENRLTGLLESLRDRVVRNDLKGFTLLVEGRQSVNVRFDSFRSMGGDA